MRELEAALAESEGRLREVQGRLMEVEAAWKGGPAVWNVNPQRFGPAVAAGQLQQLPFDEMVRGACARG